MSGSSEPVRLLYQNQAANGHDVEQDFDYGFAAANALQEQFSGPPNMPSESDMDRHPSSERSSNRNQPLTERAVSQSNVLDRRNPEEYRESLPSYQKHSYENMRKLSSHLQWAEPASCMTKSVAISRTRHVSGTMPEKASSVRSVGGSRMSLSMIPTSSREHDSINSRTMVVRRSPERVEQLWHKQSGKTFGGLDRYDGTDGSMSEVYEEDRARYARRYHTPDSPYGTSGTGMLGPSASRPQARKLGQYSSHRTDDSGSTPVFL
jgi:hypothetical protein